MSNFEFDTAYSAITGERHLGEYVPTAEHDDTADILLDGVPLGRVAPGRAPTWHALTGYTRQHGYRGAVLHPSESADDDTIREWVRDAGGDMFAIVAVEAPCTNDAPCFPDEPSYCAEHGCDAFPAGWAILYRHAGAWLPWRGLAPVCAEHGCDAAPAGWAIPYRHAGA